MSETDVPAAAPSPKSSDTLRAMFAYRGQNVRFVGSQRVQMIAPPSVTPTPGKGQSGYWFEVRDAAGNLLFHRVLHSPIRVDVEVFADDGGQSITRIPIAKPEGQFEALVPDLPGAESFVFYGPPAAELQSAPSRELLRVRFDELRRPPPDQRTPDAGSPSREGRER
jgi:hypothetical protein